MPQNKEQSLGSTLDTQLDSIKDTAAQLKDRAIEVKDRAIEVKDRAIERGTAAADGVSEYISANPLKSVAIAFGLGYFAMRLFR